MADASTELRKNVVGVEKLVRKLAHDLCPPGGDEEELYQTGLVAVAEAAPRFRPDDGCSFATFAFNRAHGAILNARAAEHRFRAEARAMLRALAPAHELIELGNPFDETEDQRKARLLADVETLAAAGVAALLDEHLTPEDLFIDAEHRAVLRARLDAGMRELDPIDRELLLETQLDDVSVAAAGRARGLGPDDARWRVRRSLKIMKDALKGAA